MSNFQIEAGEKYGLLGISSGAVATQLPDPQQISTDLWVLRSLPFELPEHWSKWIGTIQIEALRESDLYLVSKGPSDHPEVLDQDNERYKKRAYHFYFGVFLTGSLRCRNDPFMLTGANHASELTVRSLSKYSIPHCVAGYPSDEIDLTRLRTAALLADAIKTLTEDGGLARVVKILRAFQAGIESVEAGDRLHQFVRCVEGFIYPDTGKTRKQFCSRTELFLGPSRHPLAHELYDIRSSVEHLHSSFDMITAATERERRLTLLKRAVEAETLARYCIHRFLLNRSLWPHFETDETLAEFWTLPREDRGKIWGDHLDIDAISNRFASDIVDDYDLGL